MSDTTSHTRLDHVIDRQLLQRYAKLMDQQLWLIGQDIMSPDGNLLIKHGCTLVRSGKHGRRYTYVEGSASIYIWAFGIGYVEVDHRVFAPRDACNPSLITDDTFCETASCATDTILDTLTPGYRTPDELSALTSGVAAIARWIARYEQWISTHHMRHRTHTLKIRKRPVGTPADVYILWQALGDDIAALYPQSRGASSTDNRHHSMTNLR